MNKCNQVGIKSGHDTINAVSIGNGCLVSIVSESVDSVCTVHLSMEQAEQLGRWLMTVATLGG
jgi:hypothetical protein